MTATGPGVDGLPAGSEVFGLAGFPSLAGGYAQYATVAAHELARKPDSIDHATAAATPMPALTAWQTIITHTLGERGHLRGRLVLDALAGA